MQIVDSPDAASGGNAEAGNIDTDLVKRLKGLDETRTSFVTEAKSDDRIPPEIKAVVLSQPYAKDSSNIAGPVIGTEAPGAAAVVTSTNTPDSTGQKITDVTIEDHSVFKGKTVPEPEAISDRIKTDENSEAQKEIPTATDELKLECEKLKNEILNNNMGVINTIEEDGKQNGIYFIEIGNSNPDSKLDNRVIIYPEKISNKGVDMIAGFSIQYGPLLFNAEDIPERELKSRFDESKESKELREKISTEKIIKDKNGKFSLELHSHRSKKIESYKLNLLSPDMSLIKGAHTKNRENSEIIFYTRQKEEELKQINNSKNFMDFLQSKNQTASTQNTPPPSI
jgi:hypothetical protein